MAILVLESPENDLGGDEAATLKFNRGRDTARVAGGELLLAVRHFVDVTFLSSRQKGLYIGEILLLPLHPPKTFAGPPSKS